MLSVVAAARGGGGYRGGDAAVVDQRSGDAACVLGVLDVAAWGGDDCGGSGRPPTISGCRCLGQWRRLWWWADDDDQRGGDAACALCVLAVAAGGGGDRTGCRCWGRR